MTQPTPPAQSYLPRIAAAYMAVLAIQLLGLVLLVLVLAATTSTPVNTIIAIAEVVLMVALFVDAVGLWMKKPWAYMLTIVLNAIYVIITVIGALIGGSFGPLQIVFIVISIAIIVLFYTDAGTKAVFGQS